MLLLEMGDEGRLRRIGEPFPQARIRAAEDLREDVGDLLWRQCAVQQLLGFAGVAEKIGAFRKAIGELLDQRLEQGRRDRAEMRRRAGDLAKLELIEMFEQARRQR